MEKALALYIDDLESGRKQTKWAEDRKLYEAYLAQAACILSKVILQVPENELFEAIESKLGAPKPVVRSQRVRPSS